MQMSTKTTMTLCRQWTMRLMTDDNANEDAATQTMGDDTDNNDTAADVDATAKTTR